MLVALTALALTAGAWAQPWAGSGGLAAAESTPGDRIASEWSPPAPTSVLGGAFVGEGRTARCCATGSSSSRAVAFGVGTDLSVWVATFDASGWRGWFPLGGRSITDLAGGFEHSDAAGGGCDALVLVAVGTDRALWARRIDVTASDQAWLSAPVGWISLGGHLTSAPTTGGGDREPTEVFARGGDGAVWTRPLTGGWWRSLGGVIEGGPAFHTSSAGGTTSDCVFATGGDGALWRRCRQDSSGDAASRARADAVAGYRANYLDQPDLGDGSGDGSTCEEGSPSPALRAAVIRRVNYVRALAGVSAGVVEDDSMSRKAQAAALLMSANNALSHDPPPTWRCWSAAGNEAAGSSNIGLGTAGPGAVDRYMRDAGASNAAAGHRRWILYPPTTRMGVGTVPAVGANRKANALWVVDPSAFTAARARPRDGFVAWPAPGFVPYQLVPARWSLSLPGADFSRASVGVTLGGRAVPAAIESTAGGYGDNAVVWRVFGLSDSATWSRPANDTTLEVAVSGVMVGGVSTNYRYTVTVIDPGAPSATAAWGAWASLGGTPTSTAAAVSALDGTTIIAVRGPAGQVMVRTSTDDRFGGSGPWVDLGGIVTSAPGARWSSDGSIVVGATGVDGRGWRVVGRVTSPGRVDWSGWTCCTS